MNLISGNEKGCRPVMSHRQERFIIGIRERLFDWRGGDRDTSPPDLFQKRGNPFLTEAEPWSGQDLAILGQDSGIKTERNLSDRHHPDNLGAGAEGGQ